MQPNYCALHFLKTFSGPLGLLDPQFFFISVVTFAIYPESLGPRLFKEEKRRKGGREGGRDGGRVSEREGGRKDWGVIHAARLE